MLSMGGPMERGKVKAKKTRVTYYSDMLKLQPRKLPLSRELPGCFPQEFARCMSKVEKDRQVQQEKLQAELECCTFHPKISSRSRRLAEIRCKRTSLLRNQPKELPQQADRKDLSGKDNGACMKKANTDCSNFPHVYPSFQKRVEFYLISRAVRRKLLLEKQNSRRIAKELRQAAAAGGVGSAVSSQDRHHGVKKKHPLPSSLDMSKWSNKVQQASGHEAGRSYLSNLTEYLGELEKKRSNKEAMRIQRQKQLSVFWELLLITN
ncbi:cation-transporting related protein [Cyclospora cayetanensis]|uniref:Cation-transporting related protein n=1 Tax=Cyclospora cayetanensis TaxID=88456 RepID=A0A1D3CZC2_9EIME|nr:cation-transporting related protein [Cyclospora cayetanensis]